jgi:hypothetical protein
VTKREHYQQMAADCVSGAQHASDPDNKALLLQMALSWVTLAEQATGDLPATWSLLGAALDKSDPLQK